jgi:hypothetical protein
MRNKLAYSLLMICVMTLLAFKPAIAQEGSFSEAFESETLEGWERSGGVVVREGVLRISPGNFAVKFGRFGDGFLSLRVKHPGSGAVFIRYGMKENGSYALILLDDVIILEKSRSEGLEELAVYSWGGGRRIR